MFNQGNRFLGFLGSNGGHSQKHDIEGYANAVGYVRIYVNNTERLAYTDENKYWYYDVPSGVTLTSLKFPSQSGSAKMPTSISFGPSIDTSSMTSFEFMFDSNETYLTEISGLENLDTSNVTTFRGMFKDCRVLQKVSGMNSWDTTKLTNTERMFYNCYNLSDGFNGMNNWYMGFVTNASCMFYNCYKLSSTNYFSSWSTSNFTNISGMFVNTNINDLSGLKDWNTSKIETIGQNGTYSVYLGCFAGTKIKNVKPLKNWNLGKCLSFSYAFKNCYYLESLSGLEGWAIDVDSSLEQIDFTSMFENCCQLRIVKELQNWVFDWDNNNLNHTCFVTNMFKGCNALNVLMLHSAKAFYKNPDLTESEFPIPQNAGFNHTVTAYVKSSLINGGELPTINGLTYKRVNQIENVSGSVTVVYGDNTTETVSAVSYTINLNEDKLIKSLSTISCRGGYNCNVGSLGTLSMTTAKDLFKGNSNLRLVGLENWLTPNLTDIRSMFENCTYIDCINMSGLDVSNVTLATGVFKNVNLYNQNTLSLDLSTWNTNKNCNFYEMFAGAKNVRVDLGKNPFFHSDQFGMTDMFTGATNIICYSGNEECITKMINAGYTSYINDVSDETKYRRIIGKIDYSWYKNIYNAKGNVMCSSNINGEFWAYDSNVIDGVLETYEDNYAYLFGTGGYNTPAELQELIIESPSNAVVTTNGLDLTGICLNAGDYDYGRLGYIKIDLNFGGMTAKEKVENAFYVLQTYSPYLSEAPTIVLGRTVDFINGPFPSTVSSFSGLNIFTGGCVVIDKDYIPQTLKSAYSNINFYS